MASSSSHLSEQDLGDPQLLPKKLNIRSMLNNVQGTGKFQAILVKKQ